MKTSNFHLGKSNVSHTKSPSKSTLTVTSQRNVFCMFPQRICICIWITKQTNKLFFYLPRGYGLEHNQVLPKVTAGYMRKNLHVIAFRITADGQ